MEISLHVIFLSWSIWRRLSRDTDYSWLPKSSRVCVRKWCYLLNSVKRMCGAWWLMQFLAWVVQVHLWYSPSRTFLVNQYSDLNISLRYHRRMKKLQCFMITFLFSIFSLFAVEWRRKMSPTEGRKIDKHSKWWSLHWPPPSVPDSQQPFRHADPEEH